MPQYPRVAIDRSSSTRSFRFAIVVFNPPVSGRLRLRHVGLLLVGRHDLAGRTSLPNAAVVEPNHALAQIRYRVQIVADHHYDPGMVQKLFDAGPRLALKGQIAGAEHFIDDQDFGFDRRGDRKREPHHHAGRVIAYGHFQKVAQFAELRDLRGLVARRPAGVSP